MERTDGNGGKVRTFQVALRWGEGEDWSLLDSWLEELQGEGDEIITIHFSEDLDRAVVVYREGGKA